MTRKANGATQPPTRTATNSTRGLDWPRSLAGPGTDPFDAIEWVKRSAVIDGKDGEAVFRQDDVESSEELVRACDQHRRIEALPRAARDAGAREQRAAADRPRGRHDRRLGAKRELLRWRVGPRGVLRRSEAPAHPPDGDFASPVWFNCGVEQPPQCSACFINSVDDTMESILSLAKTEGMLFKFGSGTGTNLSPCARRARTCAAAGPPRGQCRS